eukprot:6214816-Pleurochrysis_carterae.AAC.4
MEMTKVTDRLRTGLSTEEKTGPVLSADHPFLPRVENEGVRLQTQNLEYDSDDLHVISVENRRQHVFSATQAYREWPRQQTDRRLKAEEELALRQLISGILPEWQDTDNKREKGVVALLTSWMADTMNWARIQMKTWVTTKNEHKACVQRRCDNRAKMHMAFQR